MNDVANVQASDPRVENPWHGFNAGRWQSEIDVRGFIIANTKSYSGDEAFLAPISQRTQAVWSALQPYFREEMTKGVLDADASTPSSLLSHAAGYIDRTMKSSSACRRTSRSGAPSCPTAVCAWSRTASRQRVSRRSSGPRSLYRYRKTHNDGVFDATHGNHAPAARPASSLVCRIPTVAGASSATIVASRCMASTADRAQEGRASADRRHVPNDEVIRYAKNSPSRSARSTNSRSWPALRIRYLPTGGDAQEAVQWTYFGYLGAIKEPTARPCRLAASAPSSTSSSSATWPRRSPKPAPRNSLTSLCIKLRIVRFLRTPEYDALFSGDPIGPPSASGA